MPLSAEVLFQLALVAVASWLLWRASRHIESASHGLAAYYRVPDLIRGSVFTAIVSSMPELASILLATFLHHEFDLGLSVIVGSAIFNILVIPSLSVLASPKRFKVEPVASSREMLFYLVSVMLLLFVVFLAAYQAEPPWSSQGFLPVKSALFLLAWYGVYLWIQIRLALKGGAKFSKPPLALWRAWVTI